MNAVLLIAEASLSGHAAAVYTSPDHALQAVVTTNATGEAKVQVRTLQGHVLFTRDDRSKDGAHGRGVAHAAWTADSRYFVASTAASGGHQPWARPIWVYSRERNRTIELSDFGVQATGDFRLKSPDIVETTILCTSGNRNRHYTFSLHPLLSTGRLPNSPCPVPQTRP